VERANGGVNRWLMGGYPVKYVSYMGKKVKNFPAQQLTNHETEIEGGSDALPVVAASSSFSFSERRRNRAATGGKKWK